MIQGESPQVFTVLQECMEASVRLLTDRYPAFFSDAAAESFLNASRAESNLNSRGHRYSNQKSSSDMDRLRAQARVWFKDDYDLYDAAVSQFRGHLESSNVDQGVIQECIAKLDGTFN